MDHITALYILNQIILDFIAIVTEEAKTISDYDGQSASVLVYGDMYSILTRVLIELRHLVILL